MKKQGRPVAVDLFCCAGGMSLGFEQAGFDVLAAVDIEKIHTETHLKNFPNCRTWCTDLSAVHGEQLRRETGIGDKQIGCIFAGPPCQGFSLIGKRLRDDPRNLLLHDLARLIIELSPSYFVVEIRHLDRQLPRVKGKKVTARRVPLADIKKYENIYRYFPTFAETVVSLLVGRWTPWAQYRNAGLGLSSALFFHSNAEP
jgi:hypothetical protein